MDDLNLDTLSPIPVYLDDSDTPTRAYMFFRIDVEDDHPFPDDETLVQWLQNMYPLQHPYIWLLCQELAVIVNFDDVESYIGQLQTTSSSPMSISVNNIYGHTNEDSSIQEAINESFELAASHVSCSGLTKKLIFENIQVTKYCQEQEDESEICVVCQVEFETNERVAVLQCKHQYHPECITQWLLRKNVCPICKGQVLG